MGLFGFLKRKPSEQQGAGSPDFNINSLPTDLPPIGGMASQPGTASDLLPPSFDEYNAPRQGQDMGTTGMNIGPAAAQQPQGPSHEMGLQDFSLPDIEDAQSGSMQQPAYPKLKLSADEIEHLFLNDENYKDPDWNNLEVYHEEKIEPPSAQDFDNAHHLPGFDDGDISISQHFLDAKKRNVHKIEIFVKSTDYKKVFENLNTIDNLLTTQDYKSGLVDSSMHEQEPALSILKDDLDFIQKKLLLVDKRIFAN